MKSASRGSRIYNFVHTFRLNQICSFRIINFATQEQKHLKKLSPFSIVKHCLIKLGNQFIYTQTSYTQLCVNEAEN